MLTDLEFPMYFSLAPNPGYNNSFLDSLGIGGEFDLFLGNHSVNNGTGVIWKWGSVNHATQWSNLNFACLLIWLACQR